MQRIFYQNCVLWAQEASSGAKETKLSQQFLQIRQEEDPNFFTYFNANCLGFETGIQTNCYETIGQYVHTLKLTHLTQYFGEIKNQGFTLQVENIR